MIMGMPMSMIVPHRAPQAIGAALGPERPGHAVQDRAKPGQHGFQHMILPDHQPVGINLAGRVPVSDMPGETRKVAPNLHQRFVGRGDLDQPPVGQFEPITHIKARHLGKVHKELCPVVSHQTPSAQKARVIV